ncbi:hypothetical protein ACS0TY_009286 [Phlomoides rotata]
MTLMSSFDESKHSSLMFFMPLLFCMSGKKLGRGVLPMFLRVHVVRCGIDHPRNFHGNGDFGMVVWDDEGSFILGCPLTSQGLMEDEGEA